MPFGAAYRRCRYCFCCSLVLLGSRFLLGGWRDPGVSMIQLQYTRSTHVCQGPQFSKGTGRLSVLGTTVPLLLDKPVAVSMIIITVQRPYLVSVRGSISVTGQPVQLSGSGKLFWGRGRFGWFGRFEFFLSCPLLPFLCHNPLPVFQVPLLFRLLHFLRISIRHVSMATDVWSGRRIISRGLSANHGSRPQVQKRLEKIVPMGGTPLNPPPVQSTPPHPLLDSHLILT